MSELIAIPAITVLCYLAAEGYKAMVSEELYRHIPLLCGLVGLLLGMACYQWIPGYLPADNLVVASAIGVVSGLAATGAHQSLRQEQKP